jgi:hypothetical protein
MELLQRLNPSSRVTTTLQIECKERAKEESRTPQPFRTLMVIASLGDSEIVAVVAVDVVGTVLLVAGVKCAHAGGTTEDLVSELETAEGALRVEEFGGDDHGNGKIGTELVVCPGFGASEDVFVDTTTIDIVSDDDVIFVVFEI